MKTPPWINWWMIFLSWNHLCRQGCFWVQSVMKIQDAIRRKVTATHQFMCKWNLSEWWHQKAIYNIVYCFWQDVTTLCCFIKRKNRTDTKKVVNKSSLYMKILLYFHSWFSQPDLFRSLTFNHCLPEVNPLLVLYFVLFIPLSSNLSNSQITSLSPNRPSHLYLCNPLLPSLLTLIMFVDSHRHCL